MIATLIDVAASGFRLCTIQEVDARLKVCRACPRAKLEASQVQCLECGCSINIKARFSASSCPLGERWPQLGETV
jgi:hypothetical protein